MKTLSLGKENVLGATLMVSGCCIGAGMIGLPILSMTAGFLPSSIASFLIYLFVTGTGLLLLEVVLWFDRQVNLLSMGELVFGKWGKAAIGVLFISLFYAIFVAYLDGGGAIVRGILEGSGWGKVSREVGVLGCLVSVALVLRMGIRGVDRINRVLIVGLIATYLLVVGVGVFHSQPENLHYINWKGVWSVLPILFISFGYQNLVPSLTYYLRKNVAAIRLAIVVGNLIPLLIYLLWNGVILGMISHPEQVSGSTYFISELLQKSGQNHSVLFLLDSFSFLALFTSFITIAISFVDFLRDGFAKPPPTFVLEALVLLPPLGISLLFPNLFLRALSFAGGYIDLVLFGVIPVAMVWIGRYRKGLSSPYQVAGGKGFLILMGMVSIGLLFLNAVMM